MIPRLVITNRLKGATRNVPWDQGKVVETKRIIFDPEVTETITVAQTRFGGFHGERHDQIRKLNFANLLPERERSRSKTRGNGAFYELYELIA